MHQQNHQSEPRTVHLSTVVSALCCFAAAVVFSSELAFSTLAYAQETRAELHGKVVDSTGAVIKRAQVTVLELTTGIPTQTVTNDTGEFAMPFLTPGHYRIVVEMTGFKKYEKTDVQLQVSDNIYVSIKMQTGDTSQTVTVNASSDALHAADADLGTVISSRQLEDLPVKDNNPLLMATLSAGVIDFANLSSGGQTQAFTSSTPSSISINGVPFNGLNGGNSFTLDGAPNIAGNNASTGQNEAFTPTTSMVQQFRIQTASYEASSGFGPGATIGLNLKSGANALHGELDMTAQNRVFNANDWFSNHAGLPKQDNRELDWTSVLTGPVILPKIYNGKDKTFFMFAYEGISSSFPANLASDVYTTPTPAERNGDLTGIFGTTKAQVYNPYSTVQNGTGHVKRSAFGAVPGCPINSYGVATGPNVIPFGCTVNGHTFGPVDPYAQYIMNTHYPLPNNGAAGATSGNYVKVRSQVNWYTAFAARIDHQINDHHSVFGHWYQGDLNETEELAFNNGLGDFFFRKNRGLDVDDVYTFSPSLVLNTRASASQYTQLTRGVTEGENLTAAGLSANYISEINANAPGYAQLPNTAVNGLTELSTTGFSNLPSTVWSIGSSLTWLRGNHLVHLGVEYRLFLDNGTAPQNDSGKLSYDGTYTNSTDTSSTSTFGLGIASFLLGIPDPSSSISTGTSYAEKDRMIAGYISDSWRAMPRLTVNLGLRYENQAPITERYNRAITQFDFSSMNPLQGAARAQYVSKGSPLLPATLPVTGGPLFAGVGTAKSFWHMRNLEGFEPRIAVAYTLNQKTVIRTGYGIYGIITRINPVQTGFSQTTAVIASNDQGISYVASSEDPFPASNPIVKASGAASGLTTGAGTNITAITSNLRRPYDQRWSFGVERSLTAGMILGVSYVGNRGDKLWTTRNYDTIPRQYLSTLPVRDTATINALGLKVANPFLGLIKGQSLGTNTQVAVSQLILPYPEFTGVSVPENSGASWYHSLQVETRRQFTGGMSLATAWTWSKTTQADSYLNATDPAPERVISSQDRVMRLVLNGIYELPFGSQRRWFSTVPSVRGTLISGWQVQSIYELQAGGPLGFGNAIFTGTNINQANLPSNRKSVQQWLNPAHFDNNANDELSDNIITLHSMFSQVRGPRSNLMNLAVAKNTRLFTDRVTFQFRCDFVNALNHPNFSNPDTGIASATWGQVLGTNSTPRVVQFHGRFIF